MTRNQRPLDESVAANLPRRTGVTLNEWVLLLRLDGPRGDRDSKISFLKERYGLGSVQAAVVVEHAEPEADGSAIVQDDELRPIADKLLSAAQSFGLDVKIEPRRSSIPLVRRNAFAVVRSNPKHRIDLGLALPGMKRTDRLVPVRKQGSADRITHHVELTSSDEVDAEIVAWLRKAYELDR